MSSADPAAAVKRAEELLREGRHGEVIQLCSQAMAQGADDPKLRVMTAHSLLANDRRDAAALQARQALRLDATDAEAHRILADIALEERHIAVAAEHLRHVLNVEPADETSRRVLDCLDWSAMAPDAEASPAADLRATSLESFLARLEGGAEESAPGGGGLAGWVTVEPADAAGRGGRAFDETLHQFPGLREPPDGTDSSSASISGVDHESDSSPMRGPRRQTILGQSPPHAVPSEPTQPIAEEQILAEGDPMRDPDGSEEIEVEAASAPHAPAEALLPALPDDYGAPPAEVFDSLALIDREREDDQTEQDVVAAVVQGSEADAADVDLMEMISTGEPVEVGSSDLVLDEQVEGAAIEDGWDPLAELEAEPPEPEKRRVSQLVTLPSKRHRGLVLVLVAIAALGGLGLYLFGVYRASVYADAQWKQLRAAIHAGTVEGVAEAKAAAERIMVRRGVDPEAQAAMSACEAILSVEFGEDRREQATALLKATRGDDSPWRTAAAGLLSMLRDPGSAAGYLRKGSEVFPDSALLRYLQARALAATDGRPRAVEKALRAALRLDPHYAAASVALAEVGAAQPEGSQQTDELLEKVLEGDPDHAQALLVRARARLARGKELREAAADLDRITGELASKAGPRQLARARLVQAQIARRRNDVAQMASALDGAIRAAPCCDADFRYRLAGELMLLFRWADAAVQMAAALELDAREPRYLHRAARALLELERPKAAEGHLAQAPPRHPETLLLRGHASYLRGRYDEAAKLLDEARRHPQVAREALIYLALVRARQGETAAARRSLEQLARQHPRMELIQQALGRVHLWLGDTNAAEQALKKAWRINKLDPLTPTLLGDISLATYDVGRAKRRYYRALQARSEYLHAHLGLIELFLRSRDVSGARDQIARIEPADREHPLYHAAAAKLALASNDLDRAAGEVEAARGAGAPAAVVAHIAGRLALARDEPAKALELLTRARRGLPRDVEVVTDLGLAAARQRRLDEAAETFDAALRLDPGHPVALLQRARIAITDEEYSFAIRDLEKAVDSMRQRGWPRPLHAGAFTALGRAYLGKGDGGRAITHLQDAIDLDSAAAEPYHALANTYAELDRPQRAIGYYLKALERDPEQVAVYLALGRAYAETGDNAKAVEYLEQFLARQPRGAQARAARAELAELKP